MAQVLPTSARLLQLGHKNQRRHLSHQHASYLKMSFFTSRRGINTEKSCVVANAKPMHLSSKMENVTAVRCTLATSLYVSHIVYKAGRHKYRNLAQSSDNTETKYTRSSPRNADVSDALSNLLRYRYTFGSNW